MAHEQLTMDPARLSVVADLIPLVEGQLPNLRSVEESWQPSDLLPDFGGETWEKDLAALREEAAGLSDEMLVVLVGNVVTEDALPSYQAALNRFGGMTDRTGVEDRLEFWGASFVSDPNGNVLARAGHQTEETLMVECDLGQVDVVRTHWPFLRDRRIDAYQGLLKRYLD